MVLKRKRSDSEISTSSGPLLSSPASRNGIETSSPSALIPPSLRDISSTNLSRRTRKRFRDNRPSEAKIHEHTLSILYSAQKYQQPVHNSVHIESIPASTTTTTQQTSLHSFWSLPSRPSSCASSDAGISSSSFTVVLHATNCEDCETPLVSEDGDAMDIDIDVNLQGTALCYACCRCQKLVCHQCAISNLGSDRRCLMCAGKRTWMGGIGWIDQD